MHPQLYLKTFWRMELKPTIFVAMSFAEKYKSRFQDVIEPAISRIVVGGTALKADRVDISMSGDSILTDIIDGIAHSQMILADISSIGKDSVTGKPFRNGNVMYEVGLALASSHSSEVLLIRDDNDKFLFDVSTIPHKKVDFTNKEVAVEELSRELVSRLNERNHMNDARVKLAAAGLTNEEIKTLKYIAQQGSETIFGNPNFNLSAMISNSRLLDKQIIKLEGECDEGIIWYSVTHLGFIVAQYINSGMPKIKAKLISNT